MLTPKELTKLRSAPLVGPNKLKLAIEIAGTTQEQIEAKIGIRQSNISAIANGKYPRLPVETARKFAEYFGCYIEDLFPSREAVVA